MGGAAAGDAAHGARKAGSGVRSGHNYDDSMVYQRRRWLASDLRGDRNAAHGAGRRGSGGCSGGTRWRKERAAHDGEAELLPGLRDQRPKLVADGWSGEDGKVEKGLDIDVYIVGSLPTIIYIPDFIYQSEQSQLLHDIYEAPASRWKSLKNRRLQNWGGVVHEKGLLPQQLPSWLTKITQRICQKTGLFPSAINHVLINEYLPYQGIMPHQDGPAYFPVVAILSLESPITIEFTPHPRSKDKDLSVSETAIGQQDSPSINSDEHDSFSILLMPCSLLIFKDHAYTDYLHGIQDSVLLNLNKVVNTAQVMELKETELLHGDVNMCQSIMFQRTSKRVSLTCRLVLKVHKNLFKF